MLIHLEITHSSAAHRHLRLRHIPFSKTDSFISMLCLNFKKQSCFLSNFLKALSFLRYMCYTVFTVERYTIQR